MRTQWQGRAASPGRVIGSAFVLVDETVMIAPISPFVLVTKTTSPRLVGLLSNARAIVTDIGGIICHAAIVAREFGIPCVVATGSASEDLLTGDLVEVDGSLGSVKLLKRTQDTIDKNSHPNSL